MHPAPAEATPQLRAFSRPDWAASSRCFCWPGKSGVAKLGTRVERNGMARKPHANDDSAVPSQKPIRRCARPSTARLKRRQRELIALAEAAAAMCSDGMLGARGSGNKTLEDYLARLRRGRARRRSLAIERAKTPGQRAADAGEARGGARLLQPGPILSLDLAGRSRPATSRRWPNYSGPVVRLPGQSGPHERPARHDRMRSGRELRTGAATQRDSLRTHGTDRRTTWKHGSWSTCDNIAPLEALASPLPRRRHGRLHRDPAARTRGYFSLAQRRLRQEPSRSNAIILSWKDRFAGAPPPPENPTPLEAMTHRLATPEGRQLYALRKQTPEPVFGIIKSAMGFRQFSLRGLDKVTGEWNLVTLAWNIKRMFTLQYA